MNKALADEVRQRAARCCEYCRMPEALYRSPFQLDHIMARQHGGQTVSDNLALSCFHCNTHKGPNVAGVNPATGEVVRLFHPRKDAWDDHFHWAGPILESLTAVGAATIHVLAINDPEYIAVRQALIEEGVFPR